MEVEEGYCFLIGVSWGSELGQYKVYSLVFKFALHVAAVHVHDPQRCR